MELLDRIFEGCIEEFKESGVKFTMDSLARRIGISKRTLYETVPSKNDVIEMVIDRTFADVKNQQKDIFSDTSLGTTQRLKKLFNVVPAYANVLDYRRINEIKVSYPHLYKKVQERLESDWEPTIALLEQAMEEGVIRKTNVVIVKLLLCEVFEQLINGETLIRNNISYENAMSEMISIIFDGLLLQD
jgi:AcrR family transcriptional regulator